MIGSNEMSILSGISAPGIKPQNGVRKNEQTWQQSGSTGFGDMLREKSGSSAKQDQFVRSEPAGSSRLYAYQPFTFSSEQRAVINHQRIASFKSLLSGMVGKQCTEPDEAVGACGEYSVEAVSSRIIDMAAALVGEDKGKINTVRNAVEEGFENVRMVMGSDLSEASRITYKQVMDNLDQWEKQR